MASIRGAASGEAGSSRPKAVPAPGLFTRALNASQSQGVSEKSFMDIDTTSSAAGSSRTSLRDRMNTSDTQSQRKQPTSSKPSFAGTELLPGQDTLRAHRIGPATGPRTNPRGRGGKPYDGKNKSSSASGGQKLASRMMGKQPPISLNARPNGTGPKGKNGKLPMRPADWKEISRKFFSEDTKAWLEKRYLGDNLIDLSSFPTDEYLLAQGLPPLRPKTGTYYFKVLNKFAQREGATPITKINLSNNALDTLIAIKDLRWTLRKIHAIDLRENPIKEVKALDTLVTQFESSGKEKIATHPVDITEIRLEGCAFREELMKTNEKLYFDEVMRRFPKLEFLDGHPVDQLRQALSVPAQSIAPVAQPIMPAPIPTPLTASAPVPAPANPSIDDPAYKEALISAFAQQSGMNRAWAIMCLEPNAWDGERAWADFQSKKETIPAEAFVKDN